MKYPIGAKQQGSKWGACGDLALVAPRAVAGELKLARIHDTKSSKEK